jgi:hypothetical protein
MLRNRIIHQNELVYVGPALESGQTYPNPITSNLDKVQSISYDFGYEKVGVSILGKSRVIDRPISSSPVVNLTLEYILSSFHNENIMGLKISPNGLTSKFALISGLADETDRTNDKRNLYLSSTREGVDLIGGETGDIESVLCFHECQIKSYNLGFSVGEIPKANMSLEGISASYFSSGSGISVDTLDRQSATRSSGVNVNIPMSGDSKLISKTDIFTPSNISIEFYDSDGSSLNDTGFAPITNDKVQSFSISFDLDRRAINLPDHKITYDKLVTTPVMGSVDMAFIEHGSESGNLTNMIDTNKSYKVVASIKNNSLQDVMNFTLNEVKIDNMSFSNSLGENKSSNISLSFPVDPFNENKSINFSGAY